MAGSIGIHASAAGTAGTNPTTPTRNSAASGSTFVVFVTCLTGATPTISDNKGNVWTGSQRFNSTFGGGGGIQSFLFSIDNATGGTGHTFTATGAQYQTIMVVELLGMVASSAYDSASYGLTHTVAPFSGASNTLSQADEIVISAVLTGDSTVVTLTDTAGFTIQESQLDGSVDVSGFLATKIVSSTAAVTSTFTDSSSGVEADINVVGFKVSTAPVTSTGTTQQGSQTVSADDIIRRGSLGQFDPEARIDGWF